MHRLVDGRWSRTHAAEEDPRMNTTYVYKIQCKYNYLKVNAYVRHVGETVATHADESKGTCQQFFLGERNTAMIH
jgi:hypothetical protein